MENNQPNKIVSALYKEFITMRLVKDADLYNWDAHEALKVKLANLVRVVGAIEVMSKSNIIKLVAMQSSLRFMADHSFYIAFGRACEDMFGKY